MSVRSAPLFAPGLVRDTWVLALAFFTNMIAVYAFFSWVPLVLTSVGFALDQAVRSGLVFNLAGIAGSLLNAWLISRIGSRLPLVPVASVAVFALVGLTCVAAIGARCIAATRYGLSISRPSPPRASASTRCRPACTSCPRMSFPRNAARRASDSHPARDASAASSAPLRADLAGHGRRGRILCRHRDRSSGHGAGQLALRRHIAR